MVFLLLNKICNTLMQNGHNWLKEFKKVGYDNELLLKSQRKKSYWFIEFLVLLGKFSFARKSTKQYLFVSEDRYLETITGVRV